MEKFSFPASELKYIELLHVQIIAISISTVIVAVSICATVAFCHWMMCRKYGAKL